MTKETTRTIPIFDFSSAYEQNSTDAQGRPRVLRGGARDKAAQLVEVSIDEINKNMEKFVQGVSEVLSSGAKSAGNFEIDAVEVECSISGSGQIGLAGSGLGFQGGSTMKIIFVRRKEHKND